MHSQVGCLPLHTTLRTLPMGALSYKSPKIETIQDRPSGLNFSCENQISSKPPTNQGFPKGGFCVRGGIPIIGVVRAPVAIINFASNPCKISEFL